MLLIILTHLFHSFLGNCPFLPSILCSFNIQFQKKGGGPPGVGPWQVKKLESE